MRERLVLGVDFDNTLAGYDELLLALAAEEGWLDPGSLLHKREIRDALRRQPGGEQRWQLLQARAYGRRIADAAPLPGAREALALARERGAEIHVVSHKTQYAAADPGGVDLRDAARAWLDANGFFDEPVGLARDRVHFEPDRGSKLRRIGALGCTHFVDDLEETFLEDAFPPGVERLLLLPNGDTAARDVVVCRSWNEIGERLLG
jgi:hypothetical protein